MWRVVVVLAVAGCDSVLGVDQLYECPATDDDCDRLLDERDPCPADPGNRDDADGDGVGDACDPNVEASGDLISVFESFAVDDGGWTIKSGTATWSVHDSALAQDAIDDGIARHLFGPMYQPTVETLIDVDFADEGSFVAVAVASPTDVPLECRIVHHATGDDLVMLLLNGPLPGATVTGIPGKLSDGMRLYGGQLPDGTVRCRVRYGNNDALHVDYLNTALITPRSMIDRVDVRTSQASARFRSLVVYSVP